MTASAITRPGEGEVAPYHVSYVALVPEGDVLAMLGEQIERTLAMLRSIPESRGGHRYAPGKWSIKEIVGHLADTERVISYRALRIARGDQTPLPGFEQDDYVREGGFERRTLADLAEEFAAVRRATVHLFRHLGAKELARRGQASGHTVTPRGLAYVIAGHELHHVEVLRTKYL